MEESEFIYILETNGLNIGAIHRSPIDCEVQAGPCQDMSIKGASEDEFYTLTGARRDAYELPYQAQEHLIPRGVSCNACLMASFSDHDGVKSVCQRLAKNSTWIFRSLEIERIKQLPKVRARLKKYGPKANCGVCLVLLLI